VALKRTRALFVGVVGAVGGIAFYRWLTRPQALQHEPVVVHEPVPTRSVEHDLDPRAEALRAKLEEPPPAAEPAAADEPEPAEASPDERRREVHAAAETTARAMRRSSGS
jgi:hypothetical protein